MMTDQLRVGVKLVRTVCIIRACVFARCSFVFGLVAIETFQIQNTTQLILIAPAEVVSVAVVMLRDRGIPGLGYAVHRPRKSSLGRPGTAARPGARGSSSLSASIKRILPAPALHYRPTRNVKCQWTIDCAAAAKKKDNKNRGNISRPCPEPPWRTTLCVSSHLRWIRALTTQRGSGTQAQNLERDIFGGSNSELSSDEEGASQLPSSDPSSSRFLSEVLQVPVRRRLPSPRALDDESSAGESGDEYMQEKRPKVLRRVKRRPPEEGRRVQQKKRKRRPVVEQDLSELPPEQGPVSVDICCRQWLIECHIAANKIRLDMQIEAILKPKKTARVKKRKKDAEEEALDRFADEEVARLHDAMLAAAAEDEQSNKEKLPATAKLKLLPQVMEVLRKSVELLMSCIAILIWCPLFLLRASLAQSIIDNHLLTGVRRWLEPLPDRSLPALNIQLDFFPILQKMEFIDSEVLKESGLGRIVLFYTKCKRVTPEIARIAEWLVSAWSRPIIKRSASYRDRVIPVAAEGDGEGGRTGGERLNAILARAKESEKNRVRKNAVMIPQRELGNYTVAPRTNGLSRTNISVEQDIDRRRKNAERLKTLTRKLNQKG